MVDIIDPNNYFALAADTTDERSIPMFKHVSLSDEFDRTFTGLKDLFEGLKNLGAQGAPQRVMIQATMLTWCYAARDIAVLNKTIDQLEKKVDRLTEKVQHLESSN